MSRLFVFALVLVMATCARAHEFWIEPNHMLLSPNDKVTAKVFVGENLMGEEFPFEPRAYATALWVGPDRVTALNTRSVTQDDLALSEQGSGLHILAVASFGQRLTHPAMADFRSFATEIGADEVLRQTPPLAGPSGSVRETYRRYSKSLVHIGDRVGSDRRVGLQNEWVQGDGNFRLFEGEIPAANRAVDLFCRRPGTAVLHRRLITDTTGMIHPVAPASTTCLLNAVFLRPPRDGGTWESDWVSVFWLTPPDEDRPSRSSITLRDERARNEGY